MSTDLMAAGTILADTLEAENAALAALDLPRAVGMLDGKQRAIADFVAAQNAPLSGQAGKRMVQRLQELAVENKRLLERAIAVQGRVIGVVARSAAPVVAPSGYGVSSRRATRPTALAILARA
jgi:hypothetical protein